MALNIKKDFAHTRERKPDLTTLVYGKIPPQAQELEEAILGACMLEKDTFEDALKFIDTPEIFYVDAHQKIWGAMLELYKNKFPIDLLTITDQLRKSGELEIVGGAYYITRLTNQILSSANIQSHCAIVVEKFYGREGIRNCGIAISQFYEDGLDVFEVYEELEKGLKIIDSVQGEVIPTISELAVEIAMEIQEKKLNKTDLTGITSGFVELDRLTNGWQERDTVVIAARPGKGKTAIILNFIANSKIPAVIFSLEAGAKELVKRLIASEMGYDYGEIVSGNISDNDFNQFTKRICEFDNLPIKIIDNIFSLPQIIKRIRYEKKKNPELKLVGLDYIQIVRNKNGGNREQEVSEITRELKAIASELNISIIELAQLNRDIEKNERRKPNLSDLRESGAIEQDANIVIFIHYELSATDKDLNGNPLMDIYLIVAKNRNGKCGEVKVRFAGEYQKFLNFNDFQNQKTKYDTGYQAFNPNAGITQPNEPVDWENEFK